MLVVCALAVLACLGYAAIRSSLPLGWFRDNGGGVPYVVFWAVLLAVFWPQKELAFRIALIATIATCGLEFLQLYNPQPLAAFRQTRFGAALLGSSFNWADIPPYLIGGALGWCIIRYCGQSKRVS